MDLKFQNYIGLLGLFVTLIVAWPFWLHYLPHSALTITGLITIILTIRFDRARTRNELIPLFAFVFLIVFLALNIQFALYISIGFTLAALGQLTWGRINALPILAYTIISSLFVHFEKLFGLPIRLFLTEKAGNLLQAFYNKIEVNGSVVSLNNQDFYVDTACLGINMLAMTFLMALCLIRLLERRANSITTSAGIAISILIALFLSIGNNFIRIIIVILFKAPPGTILHDAIGITTLITYSFIPLYFVLKYITRQYRRKSESGILYRNTITEVMAVPILVMLLSASLSQMSISSFKPNIDTLISEIEIEGLEKGILSNNVVQFRSDDLLVYIKPQTPIFKGDHSPMFCWRGSGFKLKREKTTNIMSYKILTAELHKNDEVLYTAWWYSNGESVTIDQIDWRLQTISSGTGFRLVNLTSDSQEKLLLKCEEMVGNIIPASNQFIE